MNVNNSVLLEDGMVMNTHDYVPFKFLYDINQGITQNTIQTQTVPIVKNGAKLAYLNYFNSESNRELLKTLLQEATLRYLSLLMTQPFEIAKTILQCQYHAKPRLQEDKISEKRTYEESDDSVSISSNESDQSYLYNPNISTVSLNMSSTLKENIVDREGYVLLPMENNELLFPWQINVQNSTIRTVISALWDKEGIFGLWKAQNVSYIYNILFSIIESWTSSFLSSVLSFPDFFSYAIDFDHLISSFFISLASSAFTSFLLAPIDTARTRIIMTPRSLKSYEFSNSNSFFSFCICPSKLVIPTLLYATLPNAASFIIPILFNKCRLFIDPYETPIMYNIILLITSLTHLSIKLPLETVLRRAQLHVSNVRRTLVKPGKYAGISGTIWYILHEENSGSYGLNGFYYGWKISLYSLVGIWCLGLTSFSSDLSSNFTSGLSSSS